MFAFDLAVEYTYRNECRLQDSPGLQRVGFGILNGMGDKMRERRDKIGNVFSAVVDTMPGRRMSNVSGIEQKIYNEPKSNKRPHLLSPAHIDKMKELPF